MVIEKFGKDILRFLIKPNALKNFYDLNTLFGSWKNFSSINNK